MAKLTDRQRQLIVADYLECLNKNEVARNHGVSWDTVDKVVQKETSILKRLEEKRDENTQDILKYLDSKTASIKRFGDYLMDERLNPDKKKAELDKTPLRDLINAYGVMVDKQLKSREIQAKSEQEHRDIEAMKPLAELLAKK